ncbi:MAG: hypothetical protein RSC92_01910, partial [Clostridia bacterium]
MYAFGVTKTRFSSIENLEEQIFSKIIKKTAININNMFRLLEANNLDFASKLNKLIINGYNEFEYFEAVYSKKYPGNRYIPRNISNEYIMYSNIIKQLGISLYTQKLVYDVCNAGLDKTKIFYLIQKYNSKFLENLERKLLKRLSLEDNFVSKLNFRRLFEANNLDFIKMANNIASNGYTLEKFDRIVMCKSFTHKTNNKVAKSVCNSYDKYRQIIEFAGIPFKEETVSIEKEAKKIIR